MIEPQPSFSFSFGDIMIEKNPYPHVGEIVHFIVHAFGLFGRGDDLRTWRNWLK